MLAVRRRPFHLQLAKLAERRIQVGLGNVPRHTSQKYLKKNNHIREASMEPFINITKTPRNKQTNKQTNKINQSTETINANRLNTSPCTNTRILCNYAPAEFHSTPHWARRWTRPNDTPAPDAPPFPPCPNADPRRDWPSSCPNQPRPTGLPPPSPKRPAPTPLPALCWTKLCHQRRPGTAVAARQWTLIRQIVLMMMQHTTCTASNPEGWNIPFHSAAGRRKTGQGTRGWHIVIILVARHHAEIPAVERGPATAVANSRGQTTNSAAAAAAVGRRGQHRGHHFPPHRGPHVRASVLRPGGRHHGAAAAAVPSHGGGRGSRPTQATGEIARKARGALADGALRRSVELLLQRRGAALRLERWRQQARTVVVHNEFQLAGVALRRVTAVLDGRWGHVVQSHAVEAAVLRRGVEFVRRGSRMLLLLLLLLRNRVEGWRHNWHPLCCGTWRYNTENYG